MNLAFQEIILKCTLREMQTVLFNKQKGFEKEQPEMSAGKERPRDNSFPYTHSQPTCFCRLLSFFPSVPIRHSIESGRRLLAMEALIFSL